MSRHDEFFKERLKKVEALQKAGINPYPQESVRTHTAAQLQKQHKALLPEHTVKAHVAIVGRLMAFRDLGKIAFGTVRDGTGTIQIVLQEPNTPAKVSAFTKTSIDTGDIINVEGTIFRTKRGELSIEVHSLTLLSKSLASLPDKWHGLEDKEERYRKRYVDLLMNPDVKKTFETRATILGTLRSYLQEEGFLEVETPALQSIYGGASATPFKTHLNALDISLYLSISPELYLKRLVVGGYERVFTICKNFRNEGIDRQHNPEFTMMEYYAAYKTYEYHMTLTEELFKRLKKALALEDEIDYQGKKISLKLPFKRVTFRDLMLKEADIDIDKVNTYEKLKAEIQGKGLRDVDIRTCTHYGALLDELYKRVVRPSIIQPTFLTHYPVEMIALAKRNAQDQSKINSVQLIIDGAEIMKAYDELNDPLDQEARLKEQAELLKEGSADAMPMDTDFIDALKLGLPPTAGYGMGIDRITMLLTNSPSIRDVIFFPFMKPEVVETKKESKEEKKDGRADRKK
ncbi:lysine--tRNA ligase [Candidatus Pacearchaeota archaeon]|nr:lysine--tRNA ligase [Candidatus Pacearchaeota archaeon]